MKDLSKTEKKKQLRFYDILLIIMLISGILALMPLFLSEDLGFLFSIGYFVFLISGVIFLWGMIIKEFRLGRWGFGFFTIAFGIVALFFYFGEYRKYLKGEIELEDLK